MLVFFILSFLFCTQMVCQWLCTGIVLRPHVNCFNISRAGNIKDLCFYELQSAICSLKPPNISSLFLLVKKKRSTLHSYTFPKGLYFMQPQCYQYYQCVLIFFSELIFSGLPSCRFHYTRPNPLTHVPQHRAPGRMSARFVPDYSPQLMAVRAEGVGERQTTPQSYGKH